MLVNCPKQVRFKFRGRELAAIGLELEGPECSCSRIGARGGEIVDEYQTAEGDELAVNMQWYCLFVPRMLY